VAFDEALRRPQRLSRTDRLNVEASRAMADEDLQGALVRYQRILQISPTDFVALRNGGAALAMLGRFKEALENHRKVERLSPFGADEVTRTVQIVDLLCLGRTEEARRVARYLHGRQAPILRTYIEIAAHNWAAAESLATAALANPDLDEYEQGELFCNLASAQAGRGAFKAADKTLQRAEVVSQGAAKPYLDQSRRARLMLAIVSGGVIPLPADTWARDRSTATLITRGLRAAIAGDQPRARLLWNEARARPRLELARQEAAPPLLEARIDALSGHWEEAARILQPIASQPVEPGTGAYPVGMSAVRWFLADVLEKLGHADSAAVYLEKIVSDPSPSFQEGHLRGIAWPLANRRLVVLYARMGRIEDARRHWNLFRETFTQPDSELNLLVEDARMALAKAEQAARRPAPRANATGT
jgi:tetratricopeptide (TPR) repeat protein